MPDFSNLNQYPLKVIFAVHIFLVTWGIQGDWCPKSVLMYNLLFFICILWAVHSVESDEPVQFALFLNAVSMFFDIFALAFYFPNYSLEKFSAAMLIINMFARAITSVYLLRIGQARGGRLATLFAEPTLGLGRQDYEDISHRVPQNSDFVGI